MDDSSTRKKDEIKRYLGQGLINHLKKQVMSSSRIKKPELTRLYRLVFGPEISLTKVEIIQKLANSLIMDMYLYMDTQMELDDFLLVSENKKNVLKAKILLFVEQRMKDYGMNMLVTGAKTFLSKIINLFPLVGQSNHPPHNNVHPLNHNSVVENVWGSHPSIIKCFCQNSFSQAKKMKECYRCRRFFHHDCFWNTQHDANAQCPFCFLQFCLPHRPAKKVLFAGYLPALRKDKFQYRMLFPCSVEEKTMKNMIIQARCAKFSLKDRYELCWPDSCSLFLGKAKLQDMKPLPSNSPLKRRHDDPVRIDKYRINSQNEFIVEEKIISEQSYRVGRKSPHLIMIVAAEDLSHTDLTRKMSQKSVGVEKCKESLKEYLQYGSKQLMIQKLAVSLRCQFYGQRIKIPVRSVQCKTHYQPFDLENYIYSSMQAKNATKKWKCPICNQRAYDIFVDEYLMDLMKKKQHTMEISFRGDAEPQIYQEMEEEQESDHEEKTKKVPELFDVIDLQSEEKLPQPERPVQPKPPSPRKDIQERKQIMEVENQSIQVEIRQQQFHRIEKQHQLISEEEQNESECQIMRQRLRKDFFLEEDHLRKKRKPEIQIILQEEKPILEKYLFFPPAPQKDIIDCEQIPDKGNFVRGSRKKIDIFGISEEEGQSNSQEAVQKSQIIRKKNTKISKIVGKMNEKKRKVFKEPEVIDICSDEEPESQLQNSQQQWLSRKQQQLRLQHQSLHKFESKLNFNDIDYFHSSISQIFNDCL